MPLNIRSEEVNLLAERLATRRHMSKTAAVKLALENELRREEGDSPYPAWLQELQARIRCYPPTGLEADKAFFDSLNDE
ncbi:MAG: type II toxin-antitoxin system VapB family antitoxin [Acetobacteraceae bacterium]|nr:type II toxin-antitoxin system VapB family antitoxin [Acetobacteraceae bacterium]